MKKKSEELRALVADSLEVLSTFDDDSAGVKKEDSWSKKELLGHLVDSAANNHIRFVKLQYLDSPKFFGYDQDEWVTAQKYNGMNWIDLVNFWSEYNFHLARIIEHVDSGKLNNIVKNGRELAFIIPDSDPTLEYLIKDYITHLKHHLANLLNEK